MLDSVIITRNISRLYYRNAGFPSVKIEIHKILTKFRISKTINTWSICVITIFYCRTIRIARLKLHDSGTIMIEMSDTSQKPKSLYFDIECGQSGKNF